MSMRHFPLIWAVLVLTFDVKDVCVGNTQILDPIFSVFSSQLA